MKGKVCGTHLVLWGSGTRDTRSWRRGGGRAQPLSITPNSAAAGEVQMEGEGEGVGCYGMGCCSPHTDHRAPNTKPLVVASRAQQRRADLTVSGCAGRKHRKEDGVSDTVVREAAAAVETLRPVHYYHLSSRRYSSPIPWPVLLGRSN
jgi:hypothetical protein